jgi:hypothetical protein
MPYSFGDFTYDNPRSSYKGLPVEEMAATAKKLDTDYWQNKDYYDKLEITNRNLLVDSQDEAVKAQALAELNKIKDYQANNNFEHAGNIVRDISKNIATNQPFRAAVMNKAKMEEANALKEKLRSEGKVPLDLSPEYKGAVNSDGTINYWKHDISPELNYSDQAQKIWTQIASDAYADKELTQDEFNKIKSGSWEGISQQKINKLIKDATNLYNNSPEGIQHYRKFAEKEKVANPKQSIEDFVKSAGNLRVFNKTEAKYMDASSSSSSSSLPNMPAEWDSEIETNENINDDYTKGTPLEGTEFKDGKPVSKLTTPYTTLNGALETVKKLGGMQYGISPGLSSDDYKVIAPDKKAENFLYETKLNIAKNKVKILQQQGVPQEAIEKQLEEINNLNPEEIKNIWQKARKNSQLNAPTLFQFAETDPAKVDKLLIGDTTDSNWLTGKKIKIKNHPEIADNVQVLKFLNLSDNELKSNLSANTKGYVPVSNNEPGSFGGSIKGANGKIYAITISGSKDQTNWFKPLADGLSNESQGKIGYKDIFVNLGVPSGSGIIPYRKKFKAVTDIVPTTDAQGNATYAFQTSFYPYIYKEGEDGKAVITDELDIEPVPYTEIARMTTEAWEKTPLNGALRKK